MKNIEELMGDIPPITINDFKVDNIAYIVPYWNEFNVYQTVFPVKILYVGKKTVKTVAPPVNLKNTGVGYRETFNFNLVKRRFYWDKERERERAEYCGELLTNTTLRLDNQYCGATVLLPSIEYVYILAKGMEVKKFYIENNVYNLIANESDEYYVPTYDKGLNTIHSQMVHLICKTGLKRKDIAQKIGYDSYIARYLYEPWTMKLGNTLSKIENAIEKAFLNNC